VLLTAKGHDMTEKMRKAGVSKSAVWICPGRFMRPGVDLLPDETRPPRILS
jgi:hypothetical protein